MDLVPSVFLSTWALGCALSGGLLWFTFAHGYSETPRPLFIISALLVCAVDGFGWLLVVGPSPYTLWVLGFPLALILMVFAVAGEAGWVSDFWYQFLPSPIPLLVWISVQMQIWSLMRLRKQGTVNLERFQDFIYLKSVTTPLSFLLWISFVLSVSFVVINIAVICLKRFVRLHVSFLQAAPPFWLSQSWLLLHIPLFVFAIHYEDGNIKAVLWEDLITRTIERPIMAIAWLSCILSAFAAITVFLERMNKLDKSWLAFVPSSDTLQWWGYLNIGLLIGEPIVWGIMNWHHFQDP